MTELEEAMAELELLVAYICRQGLQLDGKLLKDVLRIKTEFNEQKALSEEEEAAFWQYFNELVKQVAPASVVSIRDSNPSHSWQARFPKQFKQVHRIPLYYGLLVCAIIVLTVSLQTYYMVGIGVIHKTHALFAERNEFREKLQVLSLNPSHKASSEWLAIKRKEQELDQEFDANRTLLLRWNTYWRFGFSHEVTISKFDKFKYQQSKAKLTAQLDFITDQPRSHERAKQITQLKDKISELDKAFVLHQARQAFFDSRLSAEYVVNLLANYILPLLYGLLGALTLVLRNLHLDFKRGTFSKKLCLDYNLRILLGGVAGVSSSMLMGEGTGVPQGSYSPMLFAFVLGYNVEIMFALMDNIANRLGDKKA